MTTVLIGALAATLPWAVRERYREEWLADAAGAQDAGVTKASVLLGAAAMAVRVNRLAAPDADTARIATIRRVRWGTALLLASGVLVFGARLSEGPGLALVKFGVAIVLVAAALAQLAFVVRFRGGYTRIAFGLVVAGLCMAGVAGAASVGLVQRSLFSLLLLGGLVIMVGLIMMLASGELHPASARAASRPGSRAARVVVGVAASVVLLGAVALGTLDGMLWMPEAMSGMPAHEIRALMDDAGELAWADRMIIIWAVLWATVSLVPALGAIALRAATVRGIVLAALGVLAALVFFHWGGTFSMGMGVGDTVYPSSGGNSAFWQWFATAGQAALIALILATVGGQLRPSRLSTVTPARP